MQKIRNLIEEVVKEYGALSLKRKPKLIWKIDSARLKESISMEYAGGVLQVEAGHERNMVFALQQAITALSSGHLGEYLGLFSPRFSLRPLFLQNSVDEKTCKRLCRLGYNSIILEQEGDFSIFQEYGIKVYLKTTSLSNEHFNKPGVEGVFWESSLLQSDYLDSTELTLFERVDQELKQVEEGVASLDLIFYIPTCNQETAKKHAHWLPDLMDNAGNRTTIAFSAVAGDPTADHLPPHPFWNRLRELPDISHTPLLPILNSGAVRQGEGLWPALPLDQWQQFLPRLNRHFFAGVIGLTSHVPERNGLLQLSLWIAAQVLWHGKCPKLLAETWCLAHRPDLNFSSHAQNLDKMRSIARETRSLKEHKKQPQKVESLLADLAFLDSQYEEKTQNQERPSFLDYYTYFAIDIRNLLTEQNAQEGRDSFWTKYQSGSIHFLDRPQEGKIEMMKKIFSENR